MGSSPIGGSCTVSHALAADAQSKHTTAWACPCTVRLVAAPGQRHLPTCCHACFQKKLGHTPQKSQSTTSHFVFARWAQFQEGKWVQTRKIDALNMYRATSPKCTHVGKHRQEVSHVSHSQACLSMVVFDMNFKGLRPCEAVKRMKLEAMPRICTSHWHYVATFLILEALMAAKRPAVLEMTNFFCLFCGPMWTRFESTATTFLNVLGALLISSAPQVEAKTPLEGWVFWVAWRVLDRYTHSKVRRALGVKDKTHMWYPDCSHGQTSLFFCAQRCVFNKSVAMFRKNVQTMLTPWPKK